MTNRTVVSSHPPVPNISEHRATDDTFQKFEKFFFEKTKTNTTSQMAWNLCYTNN